jgi:hypothetical protein
MNIEARELINKFDAHMQKQLKDEFKLRVWSLKLLLNSVEHQLQTFKIDSDIKVRDDITFKLSQVPLLFEKICSISNDYDEEVHK